jgi:ribonuclease P protein component
MLLGCYGEMVTLPFIGIDKFQHLNTTTLHHQISPSQHNTISTQHHHLMTSSQQLPKSERINSKKLIDRLFKGGGAKSMSAFPLRVVFMTEDGDAHEPLAQMMVSVPKRFFKRAVKRNLVKRLVREAYRRNKQVLIDTLQTVEQRKTLSLCFIWTDHNLRSYEEVERKTANLLQRIAEKIGKDMAEEAENVEQ